MWILVEFQTGDIGCFYQMSSYTFMICHCILSLLIGTFQEICWWHWLLLLQLQLSFGLKWSVSCLIYFYHCSFLSMQKKKIKTTNLIHARGQWVEWMEAYIAYVPVVGNSRWSFLQIVCFSVCLPMHLTFSMVGPGHTSVWDVWEAVHVDCYQRNRERKWYFLAPDSPNGVFEVCSKQ